MWLVVVAILAAHLSACTSAQSVAVCSRTCGTSLATLGEESPIDAVLRQLPPTTPSWRYYVHGSIGLEGTLRSLGPIDVLLIELVDEDQLAVLREATVVAQLFVVPSATSPGLPPLEEAGSTTAWSTYVDVAADIHGYVAAAAACSLAATAQQVGFLGSAPTGLTRRARAGLNRGVATRCPAATASSSTSNITALAGSFHGLDADAIVKGNLSSTVRVLVTFGVEAAAYGAELVADPNSSVEYLLPLYHGSPNATLPAPAVVVPDYYDLFVAVRGTPGAVERAGPPAGSGSGTLSAVHAATLALVTVNDCVPLCHSPGGSVSAAVDASLVAAAARTAAREALLGLQSGSLETGFDRTSYTIEQAPTTPGWATRNTELFDATAGHAHAEIHAGSYLVQLAGDFWYVIPTGTHVEPPLVFDPVSLSFEVGQFAPGAAPPQRSAGFALIDRRTAIVFGSNVSDSCVRLTANTPGTVSANQFICAGCPTNSTGMSATFSAAAEGVMLFGGLGRDLSVSAGLHIYNPRTEICAPWVDVAGAPQARFGHTAAAWSHATSIGNVFDTEWMVFAGGGGGGKGISTPPQALALNQRRWAQWPESGAFSKLLPGRPCIAQRDGQLFLHDESAIAFGAGVGRWGAAAPETDEGASDGTLPELVSCGLHHAHPPAVATSVASRFRTIRTDAIGNGRLVSVWVVPRVCAATEDGTVPSPGFGECMSCPAKHVAEGTVCVPCATRHVMAWATFEAKSRCWANYDAMGIVAITFVVLLMTFVSPTVHLFLRLYADILRSRRNRSAAVQLSEAVASMMLERVAHFAKVKEPTRVETALSCCVKSLKYYRRVMPDPALRSADACNAQLQREDEEQANHVLLYQDRNYMPTTPQTEPLDAAQSAALVLLDSTPREPSPNAHHPPRVMEAYVRPVGGALQQPYLQRTSGGDGDEDELGEDDDSLSGGYTAAGRFTSRRASLHLQSSLGVSSEKRSQELVNYMLKALSCRLLPMNAAVVVFTFADLPRWAEQQRPSTLPSRIGKLNDFVMHRVRVLGGTVDAIVGDRVHASWNASVQHAQPLQAACKAAFEITHSVLLERFGISAFAGVAFGQVYGGFVGCEGDDAPPFRQHTLFGPPVVEATNLSHASLWLRIPVLLPWTFESALRCQFIIRFVARLQFANVASSALYVGELAGLQRDAETVWEYAKLAEHVKRFNEVMEKGVNERRQATGALAARLLDGMPKRYIQILQHALATGSLPSMVVPRAW